jgi:hypothetical protein
MRKARERGAACPIPQSSRRKPPSSTSAAPGVGAAVSSPAGKGAALIDASSRSSPDAGLRALLVTLKQQNDIIAAIEEEGHHLPDGITDASRDQERWLEQALEPRRETLGRIITTVAATPAGLRVKAEALRLVALAYAFSEEDETLEEIAEYGGAWARLALSLARDVLAWGAAG